jgi:trehalose synthase
VAEILHSLVVLMNELKINTEWRLFKGNPDFFNVTKKFHNTLQGLEGSLPEEERKIYLDMVKRNAVMNHYDHEDFVVIHDPQPLALIDHYKERKQPWVWRCHIDITTPNMEVWNFLFPFMKQYDGIIVSMDKYKKADMGRPYHIINPSIDPLIAKNRDMSDQEAESLITKAGLDASKPIVTQISRFDIWKNPEGVIRMFKKVKEQVPDAQLAMIGEFASDDPEGPGMYKKVTGAAEGVSGVHFITNASNELVNAVQRKAAVVFQNSTREGFALTVSEALWKGTPVIATNVGGIPLQVIDGQTGFLISSEEEGVKRCAQLIQDKDLRQRIGSQGREHVRKNFLITRHLQDYINLANHYIKA